VIKITSRFFFYYIGNSMILGNKHIGMKMREADIGWRHPPKDGFHSAEPRIPKFELPSHAA